MTSANSPTTLLPTDVVGIIANLSADLQRMDQAYNYLQGNMTTVQANLTDVYFCIFSMLTFIIQVGFTFMEVGLVRTKSATNVLLKATVDGFLGVLVFFVFGYALAWGEGNAFIGWTNFALADVSEGELSNAFYQMVYANTASTIVTGTVAERLNLPSYFVYGTLLTGFAYPIQSRWGFYSTGWLRTMGMHDYAGSGLVHLFAGTCAVTACMTIGPRIGRFDGTKEGKQPIPGHSLPLVGLGVIILVFGFMGFNAVGQLSINQPGDGLIVTSSSMNTLLAAGMAGIVALFINRFLPSRGHYWSYVTLCNGVVCGCASICAGCDKMSPWAAVVTGAVAGTAYIFVRFISEKLKMDDPIDAFPIHFGGGLTGMLTTPFLIYDGIFLKQDHQSAVMLGANILGCVAIIGWALVWSLPIFVGLKYLGILRVPPEMEESGMDVIKHNERAYAPESWAEGIPPVNCRSSNSQHIDCGMIHCCSRDSLNGTKISYPPLTPDNLGRRKNVAIARDTDPNVAL